MTDADILALQTEFSNRIKPFLEIWLQSSRTGTVTLDLYVHKRADVAASGKLLIQTYAKPGHRYQYMSWLSRMPFVVYKGMAISGLTWLARTCTLFSDFQFQRNLFMNAKTCMKG